MKRVLQDLDISEIENLIKDAGERPYRAVQLWECMQRGLPVSRAPVPSSLKENILQDFEDEPVRVKEVFRSADGTEKFLFELADGNLVEGVLMRYNYGNTQCLSTQVGCRMGCKFCASTLHGRTRDLSAGEMLATVLLVNRLEGGTAKERKVTNLVLMGSGEPFDNYENVVKFLRLLTSPNGINMSPRNVSLSTCGLVPEMRRFAEENIPLNLTVSLHAVTDEERRRTMPIANRYSIREILDACAYYFEKTGRRYIFEYSLIEGENADEAHARALSKLLKGKPCHVNLIRLNEVKERDLKGTDEKTAYRFLGVLEKNGISATLRRTMGADIGGACGQLRASYLAEEN